LHVANIGDKIREGLAGRMEKAGQPVRRTT
jgi:hypothetical protein